MTMTRDHRGSGAYTLTCDTCHRVQHATDGFLPMEVSQIAAGKGWHLTRTKDTCPACTRKAAKK